MQTFKDRVQFAIETCNRLEEWVDTHAPSFWDYKGVWISLDTLMADALILNLVDTYVYWIPSGHQEVYSNFSDAMATFVSHCVQSRECTWYKTFKEDFTNMKELVSSLLNADILLHRTDLRLKFTNDPLLITSDLGLTMALSTKRSRAFFIAGPHPQNRPGSVLKNYSDLQTVIHAFHDLITYQQVWDIDEHDEFTTFYPFFYR